MPSRGTHWHGPLLLSADALLKSTRVAADAPASFLGFDSERVAPLDDFFFLSGTSAQPGVAEGFTQTDIGAPGAVNRGILQNVALNVTKGSGIAQVDPGATATTGINAAYNAYPSMGWVASGTALNWGTLFRAQVIDSGAGTTAFGFASAASTLITAAGANNLGANTSIGSWRIDGTRNLFAVNSGTEVDTGFDLLTTTWYDFFISIVRTAAQSTITSNLTWYFKRANVTGWTVARATTTVTTMPSTASASIPHFAAVNGAAGANDAYFDFVGHISDRFSGIL